MALEADIQKMVDTKKAHTKNKRARVAFMYNELRNYKFDVNFCYEVLSGFFHFNERAITQAISEGMEDINEYDYEHKDLDKAWVLGLVKKQIAKNKPKNAQPKLF